MIQLESRSKAKRKWYRVFFNITVRYPVSSILLVSIIGLIIMYALFFTKVDTYQKLDTVVMELSSTSTPTTIKLEVMDTMNSEEVELLTSSPKIYLTNNDQSYTLKIIEYSLEKDIYIFTCTIDDLEEKDSIPSKNTLEFFVDKQYLWKRVVGGL